MKLGQTSLPYCLPTCTGRDPCTPSWSYFCPFTNAPRSAAHCKTCKARGLHEYTKLPRVAWVGSTDNSASVVTGAAHLHYTAANSQQRVSPPAHLLNPFKGSARGSAARRSPV